ncbi:hypothetical protein FNV43_RR04204 [Rhamnella rubrinervis]|uniref:Uncharacterized protein n=1 Tax=Rhamnella rubrinervis TaxID=2594499 RepID=A0A8K0HLG0_9ROSA|nr:hypothetical protein FNV43_RR04204 [Rhamnella rubrinervis]
MLPHDRCMRPPATSDLRACFRPPTTSLTGATSDLSNFLGHQATSYGRYNFLDPPTTSYGPPTTSCGQMTTSSGPQATSSRPPGHFLTSGGIFPAVLRQLLRPPEQHPTASRHLPHGTPATSSASANFLTASVIFITTSPTSCGLASTDLGQLPADLRQLPTTTPLPDTSQLSLTSASSWPSPTSYARDNFLWTSGIFLRPLRQLPAAARQLSGRQTIYYGPDIFLRPASSSALAASYGLPTSSLRNSTTSRPPASLRLPRPRQLPDAYNFLRPRQCGLPDFLRPSPTSSDLRQLPRPATASYGLPLPHDHQSTSSTSPASSRSSVNFPDQRHLPATTRQLPDLRQLPAACDNFSRPPASLDHRQLPTTSPTSYGLVNFLRPATSRPPGNFLRPQATS